MIKTDYQATPTGLRFHADKSRCRLLRGPLGSAKTSMVVNEIYELGKLAPKTRGLVIRNTSIELQDSTEKTFFEWFPHEIYGKFLKRPDNYIMKFECNGQEHEIEILFRSFDRPDDLRHALGVEITWAFIDEAREIPRAIKQILLGRLRFPRTFPQFSLMMATNPFSLNHYLYKDFVRDPLPNHVQFFCPPEENTKNLPANYYENMRAEHRDDPEWIKVYVDGEYGCIFEGKAVYPDFKHASHVAKKRLQPDKNLKILLGWDFGLITSAAALTQVTPRNWVIFDELLSDDTMGDFEKFADYVIEYLGVNYPGFEVYDFCGHEGGIKSITDGKSCIDILKRKGFSPTIGAITEVDRQGAVAQKLRDTSCGEFVLQVSPNCNTIIEGFAGGYQRKEIRPGVYSEKVDKNLYSHIHDALQAIATSVFKKKRKPSKPNRPDYDEKDRSKTTGL